MNVTLTWYGHGTMAIIIDEYKILVDPYFNENPATEVNPDEVEADYIWVTHGHWDHVDDLISVAKRTGALVIANTEIMYWLRDKDKDLNAHGQNIGGGYNHPFGYLKQTFATHSSRLPDGASGGNPAGYLLTTKDGLKIYLAGDTGLFGDMRLIGEEGIDLAVVPIGDNYTMGPDDALKAVKMLEPKHVIPIHYNTWDLIKQDGNAWAARVNKETSTKAHMLQPGESFNL